MLREYLARLEFSITKISVSFINSVNKKHPIPYWKPLADLIKCRDVIPIIMKRTLDQTLVSLFLLAN